MIGFNYQVEVENKMISKTKHPLVPDVVILNYTDECVYERHWNEATIACRGLILNERTGEVLSNPFPKFFNYNENPGFQNDIPDSDPEVFTKMDGSLGISYVLNETIFWATRGSFASPQAKIANKIWVTKYSHVKKSDIEGVTLLTEIIDKETKVVVNYNGLSELILIGVRRISDGYDYSYEEMKELGEKIGMPVNTLVDMTVQQALNTRETLSYNEEGWVLRWKNGFRLKIKGEKYLAIHRILYSVSAKQKVESWAKDELQKIIIFVPEEFRNEIEEFGAKLDRELFLIRKEAAELYSRANVHAKGDRKEFAKFLNGQGKKELISFCFNILDNRVPNYKEYIYKNYRNFVE